jgi:hypothetical protein
VKQFYRRIYKTPVRKLFCLSGKILNPPPVLIETAAQAVYLYWQQREGRINGKKKL